MVGGFASLVSAALKEPPSLLSRVCFFIRPRWPGCRRDIKNKQLWQQLDEAMMRRGGKLLVKYVAPARGGRCNGHRAPCLLPRRHAGKAEAEAVRQSILGHVQNLKMTTTVTLSTMPPALAEGPDDRRAIGVIPMHAPCIFMKCFVCIPTHSNSPLKKRRLKKWEVFRKGWEIEI